MTSMIARVVAFITTLAMVIWPFLAAGLWVKFAPVLATELPQLQRPIEFTPEILAAGATVAFGIGCVQSYGLSGIRIALLTVADGRPLSRTAIAGLRRFARVEVAIVFLSVLQHTLGVLIITALQTNGEVSLSIGFGSQHLGRLVLGCALLFALEGMARGQVAIEENESFL